MVGEGIPFPEGGGVYLRTLHIGLCVGNAYGNTRNIAMPSTLSAPQDPYLVPIIGSCVPHREGRSLSFAGGVTPYGIVRVS